MITAKNHLALQVYFRLELIIVNRWGVLDDILYERLIPLSRGFQLIFWYQNNFQSVDDVAGTREPQHDSMFDFSEYLIATHKCEE